jgi:hypothetical protein
MKKKITKQFACPANDTNAVLHKTVDYNQKESQEKIKTKNTSTAKI